MARYEHLNIYKSAFDLVKIVESQVLTFSKYNKYTLGTDLRNFSRNILFMIIEINNLTDKKSKLKELELEIEKLKILIRLCKELNVFSSFGAYENIISKTIEIAKITQGWLKSSK